MNTEKVGKLIKQIRKDNHLTQKDLALKYNITYQAVSKWENGKNIPDISLLKQICDDFNIDINSLLTGDYTTNENKASLKKDKRNFGIGSLLLEEIIRYSKIHNATSITLEVNEKNIAAIKLYKKYGFKQVGLRRKYYNNEDNAILMDLVF